MSALAQHIILLHPQASGPESSIQAATTRVILVIISRTVFILRHGGGFWNFWWYHVLKVDQRQHINKDYEIICYSTTNFDSSRNFNNKSSASCFQSFNSCGDYYFLIALPLLSYHHCCKHSECHFHWWEASVINKTNKIYLKNWVKLFIQSLKSWL